MAKNDGQQRRTTRKEYLLSRKQQQQYRQARLLIGGVAGLLVLILAIGAIVEYVVEPGQPVARVNEADISLRDWQDRVRFERAQAISSIDALYEAVGQDVNQLQQFASTQLQQLLFPQFMGEQALFAMIDEEIIRQEAEARGLSVSEAEVETAIEERFNFYGGELPPADDAEATPEPTPSITPIPAADATAVPVAEPTTEPEPAPEPTAVSRESYEESFQEQLDSWIASGGTEESYRERTRFNLLQELVRNDMVTDDQLTIEELQVSFFYISFTNRNDADATAAEIAGGADFLTIWNEIRSAERVTVTQPFASEFQYTSIQGITNSLGTEAGDVAQTLAVGDTSGVLEGLNERFVIMNIRGREDRALSDARIDAQRNEILQEWLTEQRDQAQLFPRWEGNVPDRPVLDPKYYTAPEQPPVETEP